MLNDHSRTQLCFIIKQYGQSIINEPKRCRGMLSDLAPQQRLENNLLISALIPLVMQLERLAKRLHDNLGTREDFAYWAVESWALALNIIQQPMPKQTVQTTVQITPPSAPTKMVSPSSVTQQQIGQFMVQDGVATDTVTGLMWCRFAIGQTWQNDTAMGNAEQVDWQTACNLAQQFNQQDGYGGYSDWYLPNINELKTLIDKVRGKHGNYIDAAVFPNNGAWFWSSSLSVGNTNIAWNADFYYGYVSYLNRYSSFAVRLVRR